MMLGETGGGFLQDMVRLPDGRLVNRQQIAHMGGAIPMGQPMAPGPPSLPVQQGPMGPPPQSSGPMGGGPRFMGGPPGAWGGMNLGLLLQILRPFLMQMQQQRMGALPQMGPPPALSQMQPLQPQLPVSGMGGGPAPPPQQPMLPQAQSLPSAPARAPIAAALSATRPAPPPPKSAAPQAPLGWGQPVMGTEGAAGLPGQPGWVE